FQAEDGIRDDLVTGVQTCALPIYVDARCLKVAARIHADPYLPPCRRDCKRGDTLEHLGVVDPLALGIEVLEAPAPPPAADARSQIGRASCRERVEGGGAG